MYCAYGRCMLAGMYCAYGRCMLAGMYCAYGQQWHIKCNLQSGMNKADGISKAPDQNMTFKHEECTKCACERSHYKLTQAGCLHLRTPQCDNCTEVSKLHLD